MRRSSQAERYAERVLGGVDDAGAPEEVVIWLERRDGGLWAVGRAVNPRQRTTEEPRRDDFVFESYELDDALEHANGVLEDDVAVLEQEGHAERVPPFTRKEVLPALERWFFRGG